MSADAESNQYGLLVAFPDQSDSFVHGYEAGMVRQRMLSGSEGEIEVITHVENREVLRRMAAAENWLIASTPTDVEGWDATVLTKTIAPARPVLKVVPK